MKIKSVLISFVAIFFIVYSLFSIYLFANQKSLLYFPNDQDFFDCPSFDSYEKITHKDTRMYYQEGSNTFLIVFHGNAGSACDRAHLLPTLPTDHSIIFVEYAGYSADPLGPSKKRILQNVEDVISFVESKNPNHVLIFSESFGSGPASYYASKSKVDKLLLLTPFSSIADVSAHQYPFMPIRLILTQDYNNKKWLENYQDELLIIHGTSDKTIPIQFPKKLFEIVPTATKQFLEVDAIHNNIFEQEQVRPAITDYLSS